MARHWVVEVLTGIGSTLEGLDPEVAVRRRAEWV